MIKALSGLIAGLALLFVALAAAGVWRGHTPVPFWDMWDGYIGFYERLKDGEAGLWFAQHNEHRIFLSRLLFFVDLEWFGGRGAFLLAVNLAFALLSAGLFRAFIRDEVGTQAGPAGAALAFVCLALSFSWTQQENLSWAFQSQFFLGQSLALLAFLLLHRATRASREEKPSTGLFALACASGALAACALGNGVLALPLMAAQAIMMKARGRRIAILVLLAALVLFAYFHDYRSPAGHGTFLNSLFHEPLAVVAYALVYLGSPFINAFESLGKAPAAALSLLLIAGSALFFWRELARPLASTSRVALLGFIAYVGATALATAGGRLAFGLDQAASSRYATPALMAWLSFLVLAASAVAPRHRARP
ncbi:MAG: hypothetical protein AB7P23_13270, partial [Amphiplicatus sp.]